MGGEVQGVCTVGFMTELVTTGFEVEQRVKRGHEDVLCWRVLLRAS